MALECAAGTQTALRSECALKHPVSELNRNRWGIKIFFSYHRRKSILKQKYTEYFFFNFQKEIERIVSKPDKSLISTEIGKATKEQIKSQEEEHQLRGGSSQRFPCPDSEGPASH